MVDRSNEAFVAYILQRQHLSFGPLSLETMGIADDDALDLLKVTIDVESESPDGPVASDCGKSRSSKTDC